MIFGVEGAPGAGKTAAIERLGYPFVPEMLVPPAEEALFSEADYLAHEERKFKIAQSMGKAGVCLLDRTRLSYHAYRFANGEIDASDLPVAYHSENMHYIYLLIPPELSEERRSPDSWAPSIEFTKRVVDFYDIQFAAAGNLVTRIDATQSPDDVALAMDDTIRRVSGGVLEPDQQPIARKLPSYSR